MNALECTFYVLLVCGIAAMRWLPNKKVEGQQPRLRNVFFLHAITSCIVYSFYPSLY